MTEHDRWWIAYCLLGAALVLRAPTMYWVVVVVIVWAVLLTVLTLRDVRNLFSVGRRKADPDVEQPDTAPAHWPHRPLVVPANAMEVTERLHLGGLDGLVAAKWPAATELPPDGTATGEMQSSGRVLVNLNGTVWTTETMLTACLDAIKAARGRGEREL